MFSENKIQYVFSSLLTQPDCCSIHTNDKKGDGSKSLLEGTFGASLHRFCWSWVVATKTTSSPICSVCAAKCRPRCLCVIDDQRTASFKSSSKPRCPEMSRTLRHHTSCLKIQQNHEDVGLKRKRSLENAPFTNAPSDLDSVVGAKLDIDS